MRDLFLLRCAGTAEKLLLMRFIKFSALFLGVLALATCSVAPRATSFKERREALQARNENARGYADFLRARYASLTNDPHQAALFYAGATKSNPYDRDILERAVFTSLISGQVDIATATAKEAKPETVAQTSLPRLVLGVDALKNGKAKRAERLLLPETSSLFNDTVARNLIAWTLVDSEDIETALAILETSQTGDSLFDGLAGSTRGFIQLHTGDDAGALKTFEDMWQAKIRLASTTEYHARLLARAGDRDRAAAILEHFSTRIGQNAAIETLLNQIDNGETIALNPPTLLQGAALSIYTPAAALAAQTDSDLSGVYFSLALSLDPNLDIARTLWGDALDNANRRDDAIAVLSDVPETSVFYATSRGQTAWALRREERNDAALETAREALAFAQDRNLKIQLGDLFRSLEQLDEAEQIFTEIIEEDATKDVEDWRLFYARGAAREQLERWPEAQADLVHANDIAPNQPAVLNYLGYSWIDRGINLEEGFDMIQRAVALRPNAGFIVDSLGWAHFKLGNFAEAVKHLERAVELSPTEATINDHLGDAYWRMDRRLEAGFQWNRALRLEPESTDASLLKAKVEKGLDQANAQFQAQTKTQTD